MNLVEEIKERMGRMYRFTPVSNGVRFNTHCLYPSKAVVQVAVMGSGSSYFVTDLGGAIREAEYAGAVIRSPDRMFGKLLKADGLSIRNGVISSPPLPIDGIPGAIAIVANRSRDLADGIFESWRLLKDRSFREKVRDVVKQQFNDVKSERFGGTSSKQYSFENVVHLLDGSIILVDAVLRDPNSINSRVVANLDVQSVKRPNVKQRIIYDDDEKWSVADLNLLNVTGVPVIPFSKSTDALKVLTA